MSLPKPWRDLNRGTVRDAPNRYALYELGDDGGNTVGFGTGSLRDELKEALAYGGSVTLHAADDEPDAGDATRVRWELAESADHAERLPSEHVDRDADGDGDGDPGG